MSSITLRSSNPPSLAGTPLYGRHEIREDHQDHVLGDLHDRVPLRLEHFKTLGEDILC